MKELQLIRHAKSSWERDVSDHERPLAPRGERAAPEMGRRLAARNAVPERMVVSDAVRARRTAEAMAQAAGLSATALVEEPRLYTADAARVIEVARAQDDALERLALVGHNPALAEAAEALCGLGAGKVPTAAVIRIRFDVEHWRDIAAGGGECIDFDYPKKSAN